MPRLHVEEKIKVNISPSWSLHPYALHHNKLHISWALLSRWRSGQCQNRLEARWTLWCGPFPGDVGQKHCHCGGRNVSQLVRGNRYHHHCILLLPQAKCHQLINVSHVTSQPTNQLTTRTVFFVAHRTTLGFLGCKAGVEPSSSSLHSDAPDSQCQVEHVMRVCVYVPHSIPMIYLFQPHRKWRQ